MSQDPLLLPHELMKKKDANDPVATCNVDAILCTRYITKECFQDPCLLILDAFLLPIPSSWPLEPITIINFNHKDKTKVLIPSPEGTTSYTFLCTINPKEPCLFNYRSSIISSHFVRSAIPRDIIPLETNYREYFENEMSDFICRVIEDAGDKFHVRVNVKASIDRRLWYKTVIKIAESIKEDDSSSTHDCAVCLEEVGMNRFQGIKLQCSHVFHVKCIAPWLMDKGTCPMCRCVQVTYKRNSTTRC